MSKKYIDIMDTTFRDGFQSVFGGRVLMEDFMPAVEEAANAGIEQFIFVTSRGKSAIENHLITLLN